MKRPLRIELVCVGTELLTGKVNSHAAYLGSKLSEIGMEIAFEHTVGDDPALMRDLFRSVFQKADVIFSSGGLGPTFDDITREVWSNVSGRPLLAQKWIVEDIQNKFKQRNIVMPPTNRRQAMVLKEAEVIYNHFGTAPGQFLQVGKKILVLLPGPARELYPMVEKFVLPRLQKLFPNHTSVSKSFHIVGFPESTIDQIVRPFISKRKSILGCAVVHGILASQSIITVKFTVQGHNPIKVAEASQRLTIEARSLLKPYLFGEDKEKLESVVGNLLISKRQTLATAESCTGGLVGKIITDQAGSSSYFKEGIITYANESKMRRLGVKAATLKKFGAVSQQVAQEMARGLKNSARVDFALSITGIAGPSGGSIEKPVGLVYIGLAGPKRTVVKEFRFNGERGWIRHRAALMALDLVRKELLRSSSR